MFWELKGCLQKAQGPDLAPNPVKRAFFSTEITSSFGGLEILDFFGVREAQGSGAAERFWGG